MLCFDFAVSLSSLPWLLPFCPGAALGLVCFAVNVALPFPETTWSEEESSLDRFCGLDLRVLTEVCCCCLFCSCVDAKCVPILYLDLEEWRTWDFTLSRVFFAGLFFFATGSSWSKDDLLFPCCETEESAKCLSVTISGMFAFSL